MNAAEAASHWANIAQQERESAAWDEAHGHGPCPAHRERAKTYDRCAESLRLEASTGVPHCMCHLGPSSACPYGGKGMRL